jgi:O-methyltransferase
VFKSLLHRLVPLEIQPPSGLLRRVLKTFGYFRFRTWLAARGGSVPDAHLYLPNYSPWEGDPAFEELYQKARPHTVCNRQHCFILWKTLQQALHLPGEFLECGVFRGGTALLEAATLQQHQQTRPLRLFDTFAGMPEVRSDLDRYQPGDFSRTSVDFVRKLLAPYPFVSLHPGFIPDSFAGLPIEKIAWAHIDVDIYQSVRDCIDYIYPRLVPGGIMVFDDYGFPSCPGARRAVDEAFASLPEIPLCLLTAQCLVIKIGEAASPGPPGPGAHPPGRTSLPPP